MEGWYTARDLAGLPGTRRGVYKRAKRQSWPSRPYRGRGGDREYPLSALPAATQAALTADDRPSMDRSHPHPGRPHVTIPAPAWEAFCADYLDPCRPRAAACYQRLLPLANREGWDLPSLKTFLNRIKSDLTPQESTLKRHGAHALARCCPPQ